MECGSEGGGSEGGGRDGLGGREGGRTYFPNLLCTL